MSLLWCPTLWKLPPISWMYMICCPSNLVGSQKLETVVSFCFLFVALNDVYLLNLLGTFGLYNINKETYIEMSGPVDLSLTLKATFVYHLLHFCHYVWYFMMVSEAHIRELFFLEHFASPQSICGELIALAQAAHNKALSIHSGVGFCEEHTSNSSGCWIQTIALNPWGCQWKPSAQARYKVCVKFKSLGRLWMQKCMKMGEEDANN